jgi:hypothetical protein
LCKYNRFLIIKKDLAFLQQFRKKRISKNSSKNQINKEIFFNFNIYKKIHAKETETTVVLYTLYESGSKRSMKVKLVEGCRIGIG